MISKTDFSSIYNEVDTALKESFAKAYQQSKKTGGFICFLADGNYHNQFEGTKLNPNVIDYSLDIIRDKNRLEYLQEFLNDRYNFEKKQTVDTSTSITNELMIYTHIWESKPFLRTLKRLADLSNYGNYQWSVEVPDNTKYTFIRDFKEAFNDNNLLIGEIINKSFNSSLRNAFAHSEYTFEYQKNTIKCLNYKNESWAIDSLTYDEWTKRFCYSFLLSFQLHNIKQYFRKNIVDLYKTNEFEILLPLKDKTFSKEIIVYKEKNDLFSFKK
jgi:hypothetical protein